MILLVLTIVWSPQLNDLTSILTRFRLHRFAVCTDIEKAFLHVQLDERDRDVTHFLWLSDMNDPDSKLTTYRFISVLFGATCSPFILHATLTKHLEDNSHVWVSDLLKKDIYVDNIISSFTDEKTVCNYFCDTRDLMSSAGFNLRSWSSNSCRLSSLAKAEDVLDSDKITKILGMRWDAATDTIYLAQKTIPTFALMTKRTILQETAKIYDPLGFFSPITIRAKILLQDIWKQKFDWDIPLSEDFQTQWCSIAEDLNSATSTTFPRFYFGNAADTTTTSGTANDTNRSPEDHSIHVFCDAIPQAYGAVAYITRGKQSALLMSKARVAPLKQLTIPKLELMAAVIGARLMTHLLQSVPTKTFYLWSDSQIVLHWLTTNRKLKTFERNRVTEIQELTESRKWNYCSTDQNPADLLTRGIAAHEYLKSKLWKNGPDWLTDERNFPSLQLTTENAILLATTDEQQDEVQTQTEPGIHNVIDIKKFSIYKKLIRVTAYVIRFINLCKAKLRTSRSLSSIKPLTVPELQEAEKLWLLSCQSTSYHAEITSLKSKDKRTTLVKQ